MALTKNWWKILITALTGTLTAYGLHQIIPASSSMNGPFSTLVDAIGFPAVVCGYFVIAFSLIQASFVLIQEHLAGTRLSKGLRFGLAMGADGPGIGRTSQPEAVRFQHIGD